MSSRGLGRVQRGILDAFRVELTTRQLAQLVYDVDEPTETQLVAIRRAVDDLRRLGLVTTEGEPGKPQRVRLTERSTR